MKFFLDENFPRLAASMVIAQGHEVFDIRGTAEEGAEDVELFRKAQAREAVFVTTDADFHHTVPWLFDHHHGVIVVLLAQPNGPAILTKFAWALSFVNNREMRNSSLLLTNSKVYFVQRNV
jgi:predicted nuclease of predicted toxin-antitoxin system